MTTKPALQSQPDGQQAQVEALPNPRRKPDAMRQMPYISRAYLILEEHFSERSDVLVGSEGYLCQFSDDRSDYVAPDCVVAFGVAPGAIRDDRNGYVISEVGKPPEFVLEVASASTGRMEYTVKPGIYAGLGVTEYWRFDRTGGRYHDAPLAGDRLVDGVYVPIGLTATDEGMVWGHSQVLGLGLCWEQGHLRFYDPVAGEYLPDLAEVKAQLDAAVVARADAEARADVEAQRANAEAQRADAAEAELRRLRERLRGEAPE